MGRRAPRLCDMDVGTITPCLRLLVFHGVQVPLTRSAESPWVSSECTYGTNESLARKKQHLDKGREKSITKLERSQSVEMTEQLLPY